MTRPDQSNPSEQINDDRLPYTVVEENGLRAVTQTFAREDGSSVAFRRVHKIGIAHWYQASARSEAIALYEGPFTLETDGDTDGYKGTVELVWGPRPSIKIAGIRDELPSIDDIQRALAGNGGVWVAGPVLALPDSTTLPVQPARPAVNETDEAANPGGHPALTQRTNVVKVGATTGFDRLTFLVPNGWQALDGFEVGAPDDPLRSVGGGILAASADWEVFLHPRLDGDGSSRHKELAEHGGHDITHVGQIRRIDGANFDEQQAWAVTTTLRLCMSIACGRTTTPLLPVGWAGETPIGTRWNGAPVDAFRNVSTWLDQSAASRQMQSLIAAALDYCANPAQQQLLRHAVSFLVTANYDTDVELSVAVPVSGLQMLAYARLVEQGKKFSAAAFKKRNTETQIRDLIDDCNIDVSIPTEFIALQEAATDIQAITGELALRDALSTVVYMRNKIIHPTNIRPDHWTIYQWAEASIVARHLLTLAILNTLGYDDVQHSPLSSNRWVGSVEPVPWAIPATEKP